MFFFDLFCLVFFFGCGINTFLLLFFFFRFCSVRLCELVVGSVFVLLFVGITVGLALEWVWIMGVPVMLEVCVHSMFFFMFVVLHVLSLVCCHSIIFLCGGGCYVLRIILFYCAMFIYILCDDFCYVVL